MTENYFPERLTELCAAKASVSEICRDLGVNRQQFARYLNGERRPRYPLQERLAAYFGVTVAELHAKEQISRAGPIDTGEASNLLNSFWAQSGVAPLSDKDVRPGWYQQLKPSFRRPTMMFLTVVKLSFENGTMYYRQRVPASVYPLAKAGGEKVIDKRIMLRLHDQIIMTEFPAFDMGVVFSAFAMPTLLEGWVLRGLHLAATKGNNSPVAGRLALRPIADYADFKSAVRRSGFTSRANLTEQENFALFGSDEPQPVGQLRVK